MYESISYEESLKLQGSKIYVDVRSPGEFEKFTIPGSINIPILDNEERKAVGTLYDRGKYDEAKIYGIDSVSKKLPDMFRKYIELNKEYRNIILFCARGGYRSSTVAGFLKALGFRIYKINGGYKKYRKYVMDLIEKEIPKLKFVTLYGNTGTGKTKILESIKELGYDTLDLERYANHKGSYLGSVGMGEPNSQKMFESLMAEDLMKRKGNTVFLEGESKKIGKAVLPETVYNKMNNDINIGVTADIEFRVKNIEEDYIVDDDEELKRAIMKLKKYISNKKVEDYLKKIDRKEYRPVIRDLCLNYYDPMYESRDRKFVKIYDNSDNMETAKRIIEDFI